MWKTVALACVVSVLAGSLVSCQKPEEYEGPSLEELSDSSPALGYLAQRTHDVEGFLYAPGNTTNGSDFSYIYENSAAIIALSHLGATREVELIADAMVFAQDHDRYFDDGRLRNAYVGGNPREQTGWSVFRGVDAVRLPGTWKDGIWQEDFYAVSTSTGNMAWALMALCEAYGVASESKADSYRQAAIRVADYLLTMKSATGGFTAGYEGWDKDQVMASYKSTEHNIDLIVAFLIAADVVAPTDPAKEAQYRSASQHAEEFVVSMYNESLNNFYTGTGDDGVTAFEGVLPLDVNAWALLALAERLDDTDLIVGFIEEKLSVEDGFGFSTGDLSGVWNEGTAHMALVYRELEMTDSYERTMAYLSTQTAVDGSITAASKDGLTTGFMVSGTEVMWIYNNITSIGATVWLAFAQMDMNPLQYPRPI
ncbi:MAG: hypothetical protein FWG15_03945 [Propionibacteriaceae bacterium]|nr:hypothetical protein [Propionibacteriaceae bacterium]